MKRRDFLKGLGIIGIGSLLPRKLMAAEEMAAIVMDSLGMPSGNYTYQLVVKKENGAFRQCKVMTP